MKGHPDDQPYCKTTFPFVFLDQDHLSFKTTLTGGLDRHSIVYHSLQCLSLLGIFASGLVISLFLVFAGSVIICHKECT